MKKTHILEDYAFAIRHGRNYRIVQLCRPEDFENDKKLINSEECESDYQLVVIGKIFGREWNEGDVITTAPIKEFEREEQSITTTYGVKYKLGEKHYHYTSYEKAIEEGTPILRKWALGGIEDGSVYIAGNIKTPQGTYPNFQQKVEYQVGARIILHKGMKIFVDWFSIEQKQYAKLFDEFNHCYKMVEQRGKNDFCSKGFIPTIKGDSWCNMGASGLGGTHYLTVEKAKKYGIM